MIEALIDTSSGEVICVKPTGSIWGSKEITRFQLAEWEDNALEAKLNKMKEDGEPHPVINNPYSEQQIIEKNRKNILEITKKSNQYIEIEKLPTKIRNRINNPNVKNHILHMGMYNRRSK